MANQAEVKLERARQNLARQYKLEKQVPFSLAPFYQRWFGKSMYVSINGIAIYIPIDGSVYYIPETFAGLVAQKVKRCDMHELRQGALSNVTENFERTPGELQFF